MNEMRPVYLLGAAVTPVAEHWERSLGDLAHEACAAALGDLPPTAVDAPGSHASSRRMTSYRGALAWLPLLS